MTERHVLSRALLVVTLVVIAVVFAGCNILGPAAYMLGGLPKIEAEYVVPDRSTVVFVDDRGNVIGSNAVAIRLAIADKISADLMKHEVLTPDNTISPRDALGAVRSRDKHGELLPMDEIGRIVGAEQIIYVDMRMFSSTSDGVTPKPTASCGVRLIDVVNQVRLFPEPSSTTPSRPVQASLPPMDPDAMRSSTTRLKVYEALAEETGDTVAKLFYRHESRELGGNLSPG